MEPIAHRRVHRGAGLRNCQPERQATTGRDLSQRFDYLVERGILIPTHYGLG
jgi:hypothetical protein